EPRAAEAPQRRSALCSAAGTGRGTRTGWAMRTTYFVCDLGAIALAAAVAKLCVAIVGRQSLAAFALIDAKLLGLLGCGLLLAAALHKTYAAIPPRPVRQFRGWVLGAATVCVSLVSGAALLGVGSLSQYAAL